MDHVKINHLTVVTHQELAELCNGINDLVRIFADVRAIGGCNTEANHGASVINSMRQRIGKWSILHAYDVGGREKDGITALAIGECDVAAHGLFLSDGLAIAKSTDCPACAKEEETREESARDAKVDAIIEERRDREVDASATAMHDQIADRAAEERTYGGPGVQMMKAAFGYIDRAIDEARKGRRA